MNLQIKMDAAQAEALKAHCRDKGVTVSEFARAVLMRKIGRRDLAKAIRPRGRPRADVDKTG